MRHDAGQSFRIAVLGDFSGRANAGVVETGAALARRKPHRADVDTLDELVARLSPEITIPLGNAAVAVPLAAMDDFHPDQLAENLPVFGHLLALRRNLQGRAGFERAAGEVLSWAGEETLPPVGSSRARGTAVAVDRTLSDFARLTGRPAAAETAERSVGELARRLVGPHIVPARDARQDALVAQVDAALSDAMRRVLHHSDFQAAEALWRGVEFLVRRVETGARLQVVLYDISAEELAADLAASASVEDTALYSLLVEQPAQDALAGPLSMIAALYGFEATPPHADLLGRLARLSGTAGAPFVSGIGPDALRVPQHEWHPLTRQAWAALQDLPAAAYLGLASPRFLLRLPYGKRTDPIDAFAFEEFTQRDGLSGMLWGHPALLVAQLAAEAWSRGGARMQLGSDAVVGDLPVYVYEDTDGQRVALPCTERLLTERQAAQVSACGVMPVVSLRNRPEVRVAGFSSVAGGPLAGRWAPVDLTPLQPAPQPAPVPPRPAAPAMPAPPTSDGDLAVLESDAVATEAAPVQEEPDMAELDALLAGLGAEPPPAAEDAIDADLDALLASLK